VLVTFNLSLYAIDSGICLGVLARALNQDRNYPGLHSVAAPHDLDAFLTLLKRDGTLCLVGAPAEPHPSPQVFNLILKRRQLAGSLIGGIRETQEMLDFCAEHDIVSDIELIPMQDINEAYERMLKGDVKYRFVIDMSTLAADETQVAA